MITFIPPYCGEEVKSNAEKKMYEVLQNLDLKYAYVLHSLGLPKHKHKIYGEIDFVVICEKGVACLEIKGGRIECRQGTWIFKDRYDVEHEKTEGPFAQVIGNMFSLLTILREKFKTHPSLKNILVASGVVFPDITFQSNSQEITSEMIYDKSKEDITKYIQGIFDYWKQRHQRDFHVLSQRDVETIVKYLRGEFTFIPNLYERLDVVEKKLIRLTEEQYQILNALSNNSHLLIEGGAGTGKTLLASYFAREQLEKGKKVLFLTYNKNLLKYLSQCLPKDDNLKLINIHALFGEYVTVEPEKINKKGYFEEELPNAFFEYLNHLEETKLSELQYDILILDEGQDILNCNYLYSLDMLLKGGLAEGRWSVFYDEKQNIYNPVFYEGLELLLTYHHTKFALFTNCRNTRQIGEYTSKMSGYTLSSYLKEQGEEVCNIFYQEKIEFKEKVEQLLKELKKENISMNDVVFLSPYRYEKTLLAELEIPMNFVNTSSGNYNPKIPIYSTIQSYKGLDSKIVVLFGIEKSPSQYHYIAMTRARTLLYVILSKEFKINVE